MALWFWVAYTLKLLKPSGASLASLGVTKIAQGCQSATRLILNHDTIPYLKMKRNFIHTLFSGTPPSLWGLATRLPFGSHSKHPAILTDFNKF